MMIASVRGLRKLWLFLLIICAVVQWSHEAFDDIDDDVIPMEDMSEPNDSEMEVQRDETERTKRLLIVKQNSHWPNGLMPYQFKNTVPKNEKDIIGAMATYEYMTPIRFIEWNESVQDMIGHPGHLKFQTRWGRGWSLLGFVNQKGGQWIDCPAFKTCIHEIGHALGFQHEQYHPERDKWIRMNKKNIREYGSYQKFGWEGYTKIHFDLSSIMLYGPTNWNPYTILLPEGPFQHRYFYMFKELCDVYQCDNYPQCATSKLTCVNEGYVSVVNNKCACVCPPGLDPATGCNSVLKKGPSTWPRGTFSLLEHVDGCPQGTFQSGFFRNYGSGANEITSKDWKGESNGNILEASFCTKTTEDSQDMWPPGKYCFLKQGSCPKQKGFLEASVTVPPGRADTQGSLPNFKVTDAGTSLEFCCAHFGLTYLPINFPSEKPFILFPKKDKKCQQVAGMNVTMKSFGIFGAKVTGDLRTRKEGKLMYLDYCVYKPVRRDCGGIIEMGPMKTSVTIESDKSSPSLKECTWLFQNSLEQGTLVVDFDEFSVNVNKETCDDSIEVQPTMIAQRGIKFCHANQTKSVQSLFSKLRISYMSGEESESYFKATIRWIPDSDMCYNVEDQGSSYRGQVNYTRDFEACLPWIEARECPHHALGEGDFLKGLDDNYCRNPDDSFRPWCYIKTEGCERNFCDVCHLGKPFDKSPDCESLKLNGNCNKDDVNCADSCEITKSTAVLKAKDVHCPAPSAISDGTLESPNQQMYNMGDKVTYKCTKSQYEVERTCLSTGQWSDANTACLACPLGYSHFQDSCYKFHGKFLKYGNAVTECKKNGGLVAMPKTKEEANYLANIRYPLNLIWLGGTFKNGKNIWADGSDMEWANWKANAMTHKERCILMDYDDFWKTTNDCGNKHNFVCQTPAIYDGSECKDFLNTCPQMVGLNPGSNCDLAPELAGLCPFSCNECNDCQREITLTEENPDQTISSDLGNPHRFCKWSIKSPPSGRITLQFDGFDIKATDGQCVKSIEVRKIDYGGPYIRYCNINYTSSFVTEGNSLFVKFKTPWKSASHFKANVRFIADSDMCYNVEDKGWSYRGKVNYNDQFEECLPWSEAINCVNNTLQTGYFMDGLEGNYCRNPDGSDQPWCYNKECQRQYCDVCYLKKLTDTSSDCQNFKTSGKCSSDLSQAGVQCAGTCQRQLLTSLTKVGSVTCPPPVQISDGVLPSTLQSSYKVGQKVKYRCNMNQRNVESTCLSDGTWSAANSACLECPYGFIPHLNKCYKYVDIPKDKQGTMDYCQTLGAVLAQPKTEDERQFVSSLRHGQQIMLGARKSKGWFYWDDGGKLEYFNWKYSIADITRRYNCVVLENGGKWTDDLCKNRFYHFVCEADRLIEKVQCEDFLDVCSSLVGGLPGSYCNNHANLQMYCPVSCHQCSKDCAEKIELTSDNPVYTFSSSPGSDEEFCTWDFTVSNMTGRYMITLDTFQTTQNDHFAFKHGPKQNPIDIYTGTHFQRTTYVDGNKLFIQFLKVPGSTSTFSGSVKWVGNTDMCYDVKDKGFSYSGKVNYTKTFTPCLPWTEAMKKNCKHHPLKMGDFLARLEDNYCRNPDESDQPWCYTSDCKKEFCDVCQLETPVDNRDCLSDKIEGSCGIHSIDCAKTCQIAQLQNINKVANVRCGTPGAVEGGKLDGMAKDQYNVGDVVEYRCTASNYPIERICQSDGTWSVANTACMDCPSDFVHFHGKCYKYVYKSLSYIDALNDCNNYDSTLAMPKIERQAGFLAKYSFKPFRGTTRIWIGAYKNLDKGTFDWNDNTTFTWEKWNARKSFDQRKDCNTLNPGHRLHDVPCDSSMLNFFCEKKSFSEPNCVDFLDNCPHLMSLTGNLHCEPESRMESLCRRTCGLCVGECSTEVQLSPESPTFDISSDRNHHNNRFCRWTFKANTDHGRFVIQFDEHDFDIKGDEKCTDKIEIRTSPFGDPLQTYCNGNKELVSEVNGDIVIVHFKTLNVSKSYMRAKVTWVDDSEMCYNVNDKGWSYNGQVNYTEMFEYCMPWSESLTCSSIQLKDEIISNNLEDNFCRNPDSSERPWCYVKGCVKQYCDVCHLETPVDRSTNCDDFRAKGHCQSNPVKAMKTCAATCDLIDTKPVPKVKDIQCPAPSSIPGSSMIGQPQPSYGVGDKVEYHCSKPGSNSQIERTCLTSAQWSVANTACLECPVGWELFENKCYKLVKQFVEYDDAVYECKKLNGIVATAKNEDTMNYLKKFVGYFDEMWLGALKSNKDNNFVWSDGDKFNWTNWNIPNIPFSKRGDCVLINSFGKFRDSLCEDKYFSFACQLDVDENPDCVDFTHTCPKLVNLKEDQQCDKVLNKFCRQTCGSCTLT